MHMRLVLCATMTFALSLPVFAATATTWYVAQNVKTKNCIVTPTKPNGTTYTMIGTNTFQTVAAATKIMDADTDCVTVAKTASTKTTKPTTASSSAPATTASTPAKPSSAPAY